MPPKRRRERPPKDKDLLYQVSRDSSDFKRLFTDIESTCRADDNVEYLWSMDKIWLVQNPDMEKRYEQRRQQMRSLGRTAEETKDTLLFVAEGWGNVHKMCKFGIRCREKKRNVLGDTQYGIHMNRNYDILVRFMAFKNFQQAKYVIVFKGMLGKVKLVRAKLRGDYGCVPPTPNYDCHLSDFKPDLKMEIGDALAHNFAYVYEYDEETIIPMTFPSQMMPVAVISLSRTRNRLLRHHSYYSYKKNLYTKLPTTRHTNNFLARRRITNYSWSSRVTKSRVTRDRFSRRRSRSPSGSLRKRERKRDALSDCSDMDIDSSPESEGLLIDYQNHDVLEQETGEKGNKMAPKSRSRSRDSRTASKSRSRSRDSRITRKSRSRSHDSRFTPKSRSRSRDRNMSGNLTVASKQPTPSPSKSRSEKPLTALTNVTANEGQRSTQGTDPKSKETVRKNLFDLFDSNSTLETKTAKINDADKEEKKGHDQGPKNETIVVRVFNQSENEGDGEDDSQGTFSWEHDVNAEDADDSIDQLQSEIDPECSKLLARLKEVENEIQQEQQKLSHLENIPKVLDTILNKTQVSRDSGASTPTMDEKSSSSNVKVSNPENIFERNKSIFNVRIKTEPQSPPPPILSPCVPIEGIKKQGNNPLTKSISDQNKNEKAVGNPSSSGEKLALKAKNANKDDTKSIYNTTNRISMLSNAKKSDQERDPRIRRMLSGGTMDTDSNVSEFSQILSRIKKEPADDDRYGRMTSTTDKAQTPIKTEPLKGVDASTAAGNQSVCKPRDNAAAKTSSTPATPDDVEKTLQELGKVIKVMQDQCSIDREGRGSVSNQPKHMHDEDFRPRNMGFSSYLPEYSEGSDYTRTARVLSQVFTPGTPELKKKPMSSDDYFGKGKSPAKPSSTVSKEIDKEKKESLSTATAKGYPISATEKSRKRQLSESSADSDTSSRNDTSSRSPSSNSRKPRLLSVVKVEKQDDSDRSQPAYVTNTGRVYTKGYFDALNKHNPDPHTTLHFENNVLTRKTVAKKGKLSLSAGRKRSATPDRRERSIGNELNLNRYKRGRSRSPVSSTKQSTHKQGTNGQFYDTDRSSSSVPRYRGVSGPSSDTSFSVTKEHRRPGLLGDKPGDYSLKGSNTGDYSLKGSNTDASRPPLPGENEKEIDSTLSKAMTSLLKKIIYSEKDKDQDKEADKPAEDRMAEMVIQMMKQQLKKEEMEANCSAYNMSQYIDPQSLGFWPYQAYQYMQGSLMCGNTMYSCPQTQQMTTCTDHPFVPFIKQEKNIEEFAGTSSSSSLKHDQYKTSFQQHTSDKTTSGRPSTSKEPSTSRSSTSQGRYRDNDRPLSSKPYSSKPFDRGPSSSTDRGRYVSNGYRGRNNVPRGSIIRPTVSRYGSSFTRHSYGKGPFTSGGGFYRGSRYGPRFGNKYRDEKRDFSRK